MYSFFPLNYKIKLNIIKYITSITVQYEFEKATHLPLAHPYSTTVLGLLQ